MDKKKIIKYTKCYLIVLLTIQFVYTLIYVILAYNGSVKQLKMGLGGYDVDLKVHVWAPYGFINEEMQMNDFLYFTYSPFYDLNRHLYAIEVEE